jgi:hypothetical protein
VAARAATCDVNGGRRAAHNALRRRGRHGGRRAAPGWPQHTPCCLTAAPSHEAHMTWLVARSARTNQRDAMGPAHNTAQQHALWRRLLRPLSHESHMAKVLAAAGALKRATQHIRQTHTALPSGQRRSSHRQQHHPRSSTSIAGTLPQTTSCILRVAVLSPMIPLPSCPHTKQHAAPQDGSWRPASPQLEPTSWWG